MNPIISFYAGGTDSEGRTLTQILSWGDWQLEKVHDWVQWVFPIRERSRFNPGAPLMDDEAAVFLSSSRGKPMVKLAVSRFKRFLQLDDEEPHWLKRGDHNHLRITRLLKFMMDVNMRDEAELILRRLEELYESNKHVIGVFTIGLWIQAVRGPDV